MLPLSPCERILADRLERLYRTYGPETSSSDPIVFLERYPRDEDREVVGWIASAFAYGRVETIQDNVGRVLAALGPSPAATLDAIEDFHRFGRERLSEFRHRFHGRDDAALLLFVIGEARRTAGSLQAFFEGCSRPEDADVGPLLDRVVTAIRRFDYRPLRGARSFPPGSAPRFFFPSPSSGSACKRWNLYLRWMVRRDRLDYGLWSGISPSRLVVPTDTHIHLISRRLGLTRRKSADWKTAREITDRLARFDPADPVRFDYALCRIGIFGVCRPELARSRCRECLAFEACPAGQRKLKPLPSLSRRPAPDGVSLVGTRRLAANRENRPALRGRRSLTETSEPAFHAPHPSPPPGNAAVAGLASVLKSRCEPGAPVVPGGDAEGRQTRRRGD